MAGTIVHVILSGIVSLVPQNGDRYLIRLQDARTSTSTHEHFPSIVVEKGRLVSTNILQPDAAKPPGPNPRYLAYKIAANGELKITGSPSGGVDATGLHDVLRISDACLPSRDCGVKKKTFLGVTMEVDGGSLHTAGLEPYRWRFSNEPTSKARRIAEEICWTFEIAASPLVLTLPDGKTISIDAPPGEDIEMRLQNVPDADLIPSPQTMQPTGADPDFPLYLELSKAPLSVDLMPEAPPKPLATHPSHRLAGRRIVRSLLRDTPEASSKAAASGSGHAAHTHAGGRELDERTVGTAIDWRTVRVNCPPALWDSLEMPEVARGKEKGIER